MTFKELRRSKGITQQKLAEELEVGKATIGRWERGERKPLPVYLMKIALYFDVTIDLVEF